MRRWPVGRLPLVVALLGLFLALASHFSPPSRVARAQSEPGQILLGNAWNVSAVLSGGQVFAADLKPTRAGSVLRIGVVLGGTFPLSIRETDGTHTFTFQLNGGTALTANTAYTFVWEVRNQTAGGGVSPGPTGVNFLVGGPATIPILRATECTSGVE